MFNISVDLQFPMDALFDEISGFNIRKLQVYVFEKHLKKWAVFYWCQ